MDFYCYMTVVLSVLADRIEYIARMFNKLGYTKYC